MTVDELWSAYAAHGGIDLRNRLIDHYSSMVGYIARRVAREVPIPGVEASDLYSYGIEALIDAIDKYDLSMGYKFETYAMGRVRGGIIDKLRTEDWVPRSVRRDAVAIQRALGHLSNVLGRHPSETDLAEYLRVSPARLAQMTQDATEATVEGLDAGHTCFVDVGGDVVERAAGDTLHSYDASPEDALLLGELQRQLVAGIASLPERDRVVLALVHREDMTGEQIAALLDISPTRVSQLHTAAVICLRENMQRIPA